MTASQTGLYAIELRTSRWTQMLDWYRAVLGARGLVRIVEDGYALLDLSGARLALLSRPACEPASARWCLSFEVADLESAVARLEQAGTAFSRPSLDDEGLAQIHCHDPDGNAVRLFAWPSHPI